METGAGKPPHSTPPFSEPAMATPSIPAVIPPMIPQPGDDPTLCLQCDRAPACSLIFPRCVVRAQDPRP
jgi:hypothetical protein